MVLYLAFAAAAYFAVKAYTLHADGSGRLPTPPPPRAIDPVEFAYLRGGRTEALRVVVADMAERALVAIEGTMLAGGTFAESSPEGHLEFAIYDAVRHCRKTYLELETAVAEALTTRLESIVEWSQKDELLMPVRARSRAAIVAGFVAFFLIAGAVTVAPIDAHASGMATYYYAVAAIGAVAALWYASRVPRLSDRGRRYLEALERAAAR
jgi:uncharacterized protein (TIGR04222 family)